MSMGMSGETAYWFLWHATKGMLCDLHASVYAFTSPLSMTECLMHGSCRLGAHNVLSSRGDVVAGGWLQSGPAAVYMSRSVR